MIYERAKFNSRVQRSGEPIDDFLTSLYSLAESCNFGQLKEELIRDRIVVGILDKSLSERLQLDPTLTLARAVELVRNTVIVKKQPTSFSNCTFPIERISFSHSYLYFILFLTLLYILPFFTHLGWVSLPRF